MREHREFRILPLGIHADELQVLRRILRISAGTARAYELTDDYRIEPGKILLVNADDRQAMHHWQTMYVADDGRAKLPTIFAVAAARLQPDAGRREIPQPFRATLVLNALDQITVEELNFIPELTIGDEAGGEETGISTARLQAMLAHRVSEAPAQYRAMVVDDSLPVRKQLEIELRMLGAEVAHAENGEQAMALSQDGDYDIIFLDVMMPGIDGYKVCKAIKRDQRTRNIPVVMLTGKSSPFDKVKGTLAGCDTYLTKPLQHTEFQSVARKYLSVRNAPAPQAWEVANTY
ncbi:MAG: response regulator [Gammaproteobacteria bacterium]|mgnify:CR=1 FL=1|nr:response regulator [Chromatiales bacterium]MDX5332746.1 response regulator [Gammaproteobacteria bacterium]MDX5502131.1 response regulator [Halomonas sp.]